MAATLALGLDARVVVLRALFGAAVVRNKDAEKKETTRIATSGQRRCHLYDSNGHKKGSERYVASTLNACGSIYDKDDDDEKERKKKRTISSRPKSEPRQSHRRRRRRLLTCFWWWWWSKTFPIGPGEEEDSFFVLLNDAGAALFLPFRETKRRRFLYGSRRSHTPEEKKTKFCWSKKIDFFDRLFFEYLQFHVQSLSISKCSHKRDLSPSFLFRTSETLNKSRQKKGEEKKRRFI